LHILINNLRNVGSKIRPNNVPSPSRFEPKLIALVENASIEATSADSNKRTVHFKRGAVIKIFKKSRGVINIWDPVDVLSDTSTR